MANELNELDPNGDVLLVLRNPRPPFAVWHESHDTKGTPPPAESPTPPEALSVSSTEPQSPTHDAEDSVRIRVSSRHLTLASPYFRRMFEGSWKEADTLRKQRTVEVNVEDIDADALVIIMRIIHCKTRDVPKQIALEMFAKIAVIVDLYQCHEAVEIFTNMWIAKLGDARRNEYSRDTVLWICISWVFGLDEKFKSVTYAALMHGKGPTQTLGLPILQSVVDDLDKRREDLIEKVLSAIRNLYRHMIETQYGCKDSCSCKMLGALVKEMDKMNMTLSHPSRPHIGWSLANTFNSVRSMKSPDPCGDRYYQRKDCTLDFHVSLAIEGLQDQIVGLVLSDYPSNDSLSSTQPEKS